MRVKRLRGKVLPNNPRDADAVQEWMDRQQYVLTVSPPGYSQCSTLTDRNGSGWKISRISQRGSSSIGIRMSSTRYTELGFSAFMSERSSNVISINMYVDSISITTIMIVYVNHHQYRFQRSSSPIRVSSHPADSQKQSKNTHLDTRSSLVCSIGGSPRCSIRAGTSC